MSIHEDDSWADWEQHLTAQKKSAVKNELQIYLQDDLFPRQKDFDILQWWRMHSAKYPVLSHMARDLFAAPASTVASESAFSTSGRVLSDYRSRLTSKNVEALICLQDWLRAEGNLLLIVFNSMLVQDCNTKIYVHLFVLFQAILISRLQKVISAMKRVS